MSPSHRDSSQAAEARAMVVRPVWFGDDASLVAAIGEGRSGASEELFQRYGAHVQRVIVRILGADDELSDLLHEVFITALDELPTAKITCRDHANPQA